jgi:hypothetical protein
MVGQECTLRSRRALEALNFFMADMQAGIGPFLGVFLQAHGWRTGPIGTVMRLGGVAAMAEVLAVVLHDPQNERGAAQ